MSDKADFRRHSFESVSLLALALTLGAATPVLAQSPGNQGAVAEVVVTASRVERAGFVAPTPLTVIGLEQFEERAATHVRDILYDLPQIAPQAPGGTGSANPGGQYVNLRNVGNARTLILIDGRRVVPTNINGNVDLNVIPSAMVERLEVVTGGASAAWGSDAVSGVVNIITKKRIDGFSGRYQFNVTEKGDNRGNSIELAYGRDWLDGKLRFAIAGEASDLQGILDQRGRAWSKQHWALVTNPGYTATNGQFRLIPINNASFSQMTRGGVINNTILKGTQFGPGGVPTQFNYGTLVGTLFQSGGSGGYLDTANLVSPLQRNSFTTRLGYDVTPELRLFAEVNYAYSRTFYDIIEKYDPNTLTIRRDNAFLPASIRNIMVANNINTFTMGRVNTELGPDWDEGTYTTRRYVVGADGALGANWKWSAYYQYGLNTYNGGLPNQRIEANWTNAVDSVIDPTTGKAICRSTLTDRNNGCIPANVFGEGSIDPSVKGYTNRDAFFTSSYVQQVVAADLRGELGATWAGPISIATGAEFRKDSLRGVSDPLSQARVFRLGNTQAISGADNVKEAYAEVVAPLAKDMSFAKTLDLNAAARITDYKLAGKVNTWKLGFTYEPFDQVRLRLTRSRDIRAPKLNEQFQPGGAGSGVGFDPFTNTNPRIVTVTVGNPNLKPEKADTLTYGIVYSPSYAPGLHASIDYYDIDITDAIGTINSAAIINQCFQGATNLCQFITRVNGVITQTTSTQLNLAKLQSRGLDIETSYGFDLANISDSFSGRLTMRLLGNHVIKLLTNNGVTAVDTAGEVGSSWRWNGNVSYRNGPLSVSSSLRYIGAGAIDNTYLPNDIEVNHVDAQYFVGLSTQYTIDRGNGDEIELFARVDNLLNREPPILPGTGQQSTVTQGSLYDVLGRNFAVGFRFKY